ncbi:MAG: tetratricopeptide repeat protein [Acidobacteria bacterium]|nr:tetratricopeptide repeat protein [Acidobacteriota bacterium]
MSEPETQTELSPNPQGKVEAHAHWLELPSAEAIGQIGTYVVVFAVMAVLFALTSYMTSSYHAAQFTEATNHFAAGNRLAAEGEDAAAIEHYRTALALQPTNSDYRMQMALALLRAGRLDESQTHLQELLQADPTNGLANLAMARIANQYSNLADANIYYHRAIYGLWPTDGQSNRLQARLELVDLLARNDQKSQLLSELMSLQEEMPPDAALKRRMAGLFLTAGSPAHAQELYQEMARADRRDAQAYAGLGESEFQLGNYAAAQRAYQTALRLNPDNELASRHLEVSKNALALDPQLAGLGSSERYLRSRRLVVLALAQLDLCVGSQDGSANPAIESLRQAAQERIAERIRGLVPEETIETNMSLTAGLWQTRQDLCPQAAPSEEAVALILGRLEQSSQ